MKADQSPWRDPHSAPESWWVGVPETLAMSKQEFKVQLGEDLWTSVQGLGSPLMAVTVLTSLSSHADQRGTFRLEFADRRILKGKRFRTNHQAERVERLSKLLDRQHYPKVLARCGSALLMEWVEGRPLTAEHCQPELLRRCGAMQGLLHSTPVPNEPVQSVSEYRA